MNSSHGINLILNTMVLIKMVLNMEQEDLSMKMGTSIKGTFSKIKEMAKE
jgi:hypothetical protein